MLTEQKRRFAYQIVTTGNLKKAADFVGIDADTAVEWYADPEINDIIMHDRKANLTSAMETKERLRAKLVNIANSDIGDYFMPADEPGVMIMKPLSQLTKEQRQCIKKVKQTQWGIDLELHDSMRAMKDIAQMDGLLERDETDEASVDEKAKMLRELASEIEGVTAGVTTH